MKLSLKLPLAHQSFAGHEERSWSLVLKQAQARRSMTYCYASTGSKRGNSSVAGVTAELRAGTGRNDQ